jgi:hypothetical protein
MTNLKSRRCGPYFIAADHYCRQWNAVGCGNRTISRISLTYWRCNYHRVDASTDGCQSVRRERHAEEDTTGPHIIGKAEVSSLLNRSARILHVSTYRSIGDVVLFEGYEAD